jgi:predicted small integral membrane protein
MKIIYRLSDKSYKKPKLPGATKQFCYFNFMQAFQNEILPSGGGDTKNLLVIADHCKESLDIDLIRYSPFETEKTEYGNAGSFKYALKRAVQSNEVVYFIEDDYIHKKIAPTLIMEGIKHADYVTLYDHPDKYTSVYEFGETSKVFKTKNSHWRYTASTCMTFAARSTTLMQDMEIWEKHLNGVHPNDHMAFVELGKRGRKLAVCIPGAACHTDLTFSGLAHSVLMDEWAIDILCEHLENTMSDELQDIKKAVFVNNPKGWDRLKMLDALHQMRKPQQD